MRTWSRPSSQRFPPGKSTSTEAATRQAQAPQVERLRYQAALAERQFMQLDPHNRRVAAELERRWEAARRELKQAEDLYAQMPASPPVPELPAALKAALTALGEPLPALWDAPARSQARKKARLGCLIDKVVLRRSARDTVPVRIVWKGGDTTCCAIPIPGGSLAECSRAEAMEQRILQLCDPGPLDPVSAAALTAARPGAPQHRAGDPAAASALG